MGAAEQIPRISFEEFLRLEELNATKQEGIVCMLAVGTFEHGRLVDNLLVLLRKRLEDRRCQPHSGNFLVRTPSGLGAYPDIMIFCGEIRGDPADAQRAAINPSVVVKSSPTAPKSMTAARSSRATRRFRPSTPTCSFIRTNAR
jgi:Uma2 family endonuclease